MLLSLYQMLCSQLPNFHHFSHNSVFHNIFSILPKYSVQFLLYPFLIFSNVPKSFNRAPSICEFTSSHLCCHVTSFAYKNLSLIHIQMCIRDRFRSEQGHIHCVINGDNNTYLSLSLSHTHHMCTRACTITYITKFRNYQFIHFLCSVI